MQDEANLAWAAEMIAARRDWIRPLLEQEKNRTESLRHAKWTAKVFAGSTRFAVADKYDEDYDTVKRTVHQFAKDIGLTWPTRTLGDSLGSTEEKSSKMRNKPTNTSGA